MLAFDVDGCNHVDPQNIFAAPGMPQQQISEERTLAHAQSACGCNNALIMPKSVKSGAFCVFSQIC